MTRLKWQWHHTSEKGVVQITEVTPGLSWAGPRPGLGNSINGHPNFETMKSPKQNCLSVFKANTRTHKGLNKTTVLAQVPVLSGQLPSKTCHSSLGPTTNHLQSLSLGHLIYDHIVLRLHEFFVSLICSNCVTVFVIHCPTVTLGAWWVLNFQELSNDHNHSKKADYTSITKDYLKSETPWAFVCIFPNKLDGAAPTCFLWVCLDGSLLLQMM